MLAILTTHPIQYQVPLWRTLASRGRVPFRVFYMSDRGLLSSFDPGFDRKLAWDINLTEGYQHEFLDVHRGRDEDAFFGLRLRSGFGRRLARDGYRALWVQGWQVSAYWQAVWMARAEGLQVWLRADTNSRSNERGRARVAKRLLLGQFLRRVDRFLCVGKANRAFYVDRGAASSQLFSAPHCVDNGRFSASALMLRSQRTEWRSNFGVPQDAFCFLFAGKLQPKKRPQDVLLAVQALRGRIGRPVHVMLVGTGELEAQLRALAPDESFVGFLNQSDIAKAYVAADCLVLPSNPQETWGLVVNEAMACGLQVVVSDACGCAEDLVVPVRPDLVFPVGDVTALAGALERAIIDPTPPDRIAAQIAHFDPMRTVETVERLYEEIELEASGAGTAGA